MISEQGRRPCRGKPSEIEESGLHSTLYELD
jgi:hypothetical protein